MLPALVITGRVRQAGIAQGLFGSELNARDPCLIIVSMARFTLPWPQRAPTGRLEMAGTVMRPRTASNQAAQAVGVAQWPPPFSA